MLTASARLGGGGESPRIDLFLSPFFFFYKAKEFTHIHLGLQSIFMVNAPILFLKHPSIHYNELLSNCQGNTDFVINKKLAKAKRTVD